MASFSPFARAQSPLNLARAREAQRVQQQLAEDAQYADRKAKAVASGQAMRTAAIRNGAVEASLPEIHAGMSDADLRTANARMAPLAGAHLPFSAGLLGGSGLGAGRGLSSDEAGAVADAARLKLGYPSREEDQASASAQGRVAAAAGTGQAVQTPYGSVSSRPGTWLDTVGDKYGKDWQKQVTDKYPQIGVAGSPENATFVASLKTAHASDPSMNFERDPMKIADSVVNPAQHSSPDAQPGTLAYGGGASAAHGLNIPAFGPAVDAAAATAPVTNALQAGKVAGANVSSRYESLMEQPDSPRSLYNKAAGVVNSGVDAVRGFFNPSAAPIPFQPPLANSPEKILPGMETSVPPAWPLNGASSPPAAATASPVTAPPMPFQSSAAAPPVPMPTSSGVSVGGAPLPFQGSSGDPTQMLNSFARNPEDEQFQKKLQSNPPSLFQS